MSNEIFILGKPNVGKSSLFNVFVGKQLAIVENLPGITVDIRKQKVSFFDKNFIIIDSAGLTQKKNELSKKILSHTLSSISEKAIILFILDGKLGIDKYDYEINKIIKKLKNKKILVINKCDAKINPFIIDESQKFGYGEPFRVSAAHRDGIDILKFEISKMFHEELYPDNIEKVDHSISIVGQSNTGKSTLLNSLKGSDIAITDDTPNLTRDPVETQLVLNNLNFKIFDTAGFSESANNRTSIQRKAIFETRRRIRLSQLILIILDINNYWHKNNRKIIQQIVNESRCIIIVINKIDTINEFEKEHIKAQIYKLIPKILNTPIFFVSAKKRKGLSSLKDGITKFLPNWGKKITTKKLNQWLIDLQNSNPPPLNKGKEVKLKFAIQTSSNPPKFKIFSNYPDSIRESYKRFLINNLKKKFNLDGIIVNVQITKSNNPYVKK